MIIKEIYKTSKFYKIISIFLCCIFLYPTVLFYFDKNEPITTSIVFLSISLLGLFAYLFFLGTYTIQNNELIFRAIIQKNKIWNLNDLNGWDVSDRIRLYFNNGKSHNISLYGKTSLNKLLAHLNNDYLVGLKSKTVEIIESDGIKIKSNNIVNIVFLSLGSLICLFGLYSLTQLDIPIHSLILLVTGISNVIIFANRIFRHPKCKILGMNSIIITYKKNEKELFWKDCKEMKIYNNGTYNFLKLNFPDSIKIELNESEFDGRLGVLEYISNKIRKNPRIKIL